MPQRRELKLTTVGQLIDEVKSLRAATARSMCTQAGTWSLPRMAYHLGKGLDETLHEPASMELSEAQKKARPFFDQVAAHGWPENQKFETPPQIDPPVDVPESQVDTFLASLEKLDRYTGKYITTPPFGPVETEATKRFILAHAVHHLAYLHPTGPIRFGLFYVDIDAALNDIALLRKGYVQSGNWTLPQICWHVASVIEPFMSPAAADATQSPEQAAKLKGFHDTIFEPGGSGKFPAGKNTPPETANEADVDRLIAALTKLRDFPSDKVDLGPFGATPIDVVRSLHQIHAAHHLSFLAPRDVRETLTFKSEDEVIAELERLRKGNRQTGNWSLVQAAHHLNESTKARMKPGPHDPESPEQAARKPVIDRALRVKRLPVGIKAPAFSTPTDDVKLNDSVIDDLIDTLKTFRDFPGPFAPHRMFGTLTNDMARGVNRIHCAHHLKKFVTTT